MTRWRRRTIDRSFGALRLLDFIAGELIPRLAERYPIDREQLGLFGLSAGGFFASWAIFLASGSLETDDPMLEGVGRIVSGQMHLAAMLRGRKYPSLTLHSEINPGLGHADGAATTLARAMRLLYAK